jgi:hypothetical protein
MRYIDEAPLTNLSAEYKAKGQHTGLEFLMEALAKRVADSEDILKHLDESTKKELNEEVNINFEKRVAQLEMVHKGFILNPESKHNSVHCQRSTYIPTDPSTWTAICGWFFASGKAERTMSLPADPKSICGMCMPKEKADAKKNYQADDSANSSSSSSDSADDSADD